MYVISKQQNKKILVVSLYQNAKTHVLCYNADLLSSPSPNPQGLASTKTQLVPRSEPETPYQVQQNNMFNSLEKGLLPIKIFQMCRAEGSYNKPSCCLQALPAWDEVTISEAGDSVDSVTSSTISVPASRLLPFVVKSCQKLSKGSHDRIPSPSCPYSIFVLMTKYPYRAQVL